MGALGVDYLEGRGGPVNGGLALHWLRQAAERRDGAGCAMLGALHEEGQLVAADLEQAFLWYRRAAEVGHAIGQYNLGRAYQAGIGVRVDLEAAILWFSRAAEQGNAEAQLAFARCLINGRGVAANPSEAARWLHRAVDQQHPLSMVFLAGLYADGQGVDKDLRIASDLLDRAGDLGVDVSSVRDMVLGLRLQALVERFRAPDAASTASGTGSTPDTDELQRATVAEVPDSSDAPTQMDRRSCFFAFHLLPEWLFAAPKDRSFDAAAMQPAIEALWGEAWRLALPYAKHSWTGASAPECNDLEIDGVRWLCVLLDNDTLPPSPFYVLVRRRDDRPEVWLAELGMNGELLLARIQERSEHAVCGLLGQFEPERVAAALTSGRHAPVLVEGGSAAETTLRQLMAYVELNHDFEAARDRSRGPTA